MSFSKLFIIIASIAVSVSALATPANGTVEARAEAASHTGDGTFYTRKCCVGCALFEEYNTVLVL